MRAQANQLSFAHENHSLFPAQYPAAVGILDQGVLAVYNRVVGTTPRVRGLPYNLSTPAATGLIAGKLRKDIRARRILACSTNCILIDTPIEATPPPPTTTVAKKNPDHTVSADRSAIADMRRVNVGFETPHYYNVRVPSVESIARVLVSLAVAYPGFQIEMAKRRIASAFRLLRANPALSLLMCAELPGCFSCAPP